MTNLFDTEVDTMPKPKRDAEWSYMFAVAKKLFHRDGIPDICRANFVKLLDGYRQVNATGAELQRRHAEAVTAWGAEWVTMVRLLKDWSMFAPKTNAGRPHFTIGEANAVWIVLRKVFTATTPDWDRFVDAATKNTPVFPNCQIEQNLFFAEFGLLVDPRKPRRITVTENRSANHDAAQVAQAEIDALLETWRNDGAC